MNTACGVCYIALAKNDRGTWVHIPVNTKEVIAANQCLAYGHAQPYAIASEDNAYVDAQLAALWERSK